MRRGLPGDTVRARVTKVQRRHAEAVAIEVLEPGRSGSRRRARTTRRAAAAASRISPTRRSSRRRQAWVADSLRRIAGIAEPPLEPIVAAERSFGYRNKMEYSFAPGPDGPELGLHRAGRWDEVLDIERCWLTTDLGNGIRNTMRDWAREERLEAYDQADGEGLPPASRHPRGRATPARRSCSS